MLGSRPRGKRCGKSRPRLPLAAYPRELIQGAGSEAYPDPVSSCSRLLLLCCVVGGADKRPPHEYYAICVISTKYPHVGILVLVGRLWGDISDLVDCLWSAARYLQELRKCSLPCYRTFLLAGIRASAVRRGVRRGVRTTKIRAGGIQLYFSS